VPQPSVVYIIPLSMSGLTSLSGPFCPTSCMPPSASAQTIRRFFTLSRLICDSFEYRVAPKSPFMISQFCGSFVALMRRSRLTVIL
jgi:hypothetical protein